MGEAIAIGPLAAGQIHTPLQPHQVRILLHSAQLPTASSNGARSAVGSRLDRRIEREPLHGGNAQQALDLASGACDDGSDHQPQVLGYARTIDRALEDPLAVA